MNESEIRSQDSGAQSPDGREKGSRGIKVPQLTYEIERVEAFRVCRVEDGCAVMEFPVRKFGMCAKDIEKEVSAWADKEDFYIFLLMAVSSHLEYWAGFFKGLQQFRSIYPLKPEDLTTSSRDGRWASVVGVSMEANNEVVVVRAELCCIADSVLGDLQDSKTIKRGRTFKCSD